MDTIGNESTSLEEPTPSKTTSSVGGQIRYAQRRRVILLFGFTGVLFVALFSWVLGPSIKEFLAFKAQHRNDTVTTLTQAYDLFMADLDSIVAGQLGSYESAQVLEIDTEGMYRVQGLNPEQAPYLIGQIVRKTSEKIEPEQLPNLLRDEQFQDTRIRFPEAELSLFLDQSAQVNIDAISMAKAGLGSQDKLNLVYEKAFSAVGTRDWFHFDQWQSMVQDYGLTEQDSLWVIEQVEVKKFKYSVFQRIEGSFSATPTPVVAIGGEVYQQSGSERNIYEVFIQMSRLRFPSEENPIAEQVDQNEWYDWRAEEMNLDTGSGSKGYLVWND